MKEVSGYVPKPSISFASIVGYSIYLVITTPLKRLFRFTPLVDGWTIQQEIGVKFLEYAASADVPSLRRNEKYFIYLANLTLSTRLTRFTTDTFSGLWYGEYEKESDATVLHIHGGGFIWCRADTYAHGLYGIQTHVQAEHKKSLRVFALEYSMAPEAKFPIQLNEALAAYEYLCQQNSKPIILMGDSAGGNLILSLLPALKSHENLRSPAAAIAVSPWCDLDLSNLPSSYELNKNNDFVQVNDLLFCADAYAGSNSLKDPLISPIHGDFRGCCPILLHYGGKEAFADDIKELGANMKTQGANVTIVEEPLGPHITPMLPTFFGGMAHRGTAILGAFIAKHID